MWRNSMLLVVLMLVACSPLRGCVESNFSLDNNARLPIWFTLPPNVPRADVGVSLNLWSNGDAEFEFGDFKRQRIIEREIGPSCWHPETHYKHNPDGTQEAPGGPE